MVDQLGDRTRWRIQDTAQQASIEDRETGARVKVIGSDPKRAHGLAPVLVLADEPAQWPASTGERMVAALRTSAGKQPHFRFVALGTRPASGDHWFAKLLSGGSDYAQAHAAEPDDPKFKSRDVAQGEPVAGRHAGPPNGNRDRGEARQIGPELGPRIRRAPVEPRDR